MQKNRTYLLKNTKPTKSITLVGFGKNFFEEIYILVQGTCFVSNIPPYIFTVIAMFQHFAVRMSF